MKPTSRLTILTLGICAAIGLSSPVHSTIVFNNEAAPPANQGTANLVLGLDFSVVTPGYVTRMGAYDALGDGFTRGVTVAIYSRASGEKIPGTEVAFMGAADPLEFQTRWKNVEPVMLPAGDYCVVAANYGGGGENEINFNTGYDPGAFTPSPLVFNSVENHLTLGDARWQWGNSLPPDFFTMLYPAFMSDWGPLTPENGHPRPALAAGTFDFVLDDPSTQPGPFTVTVSASPSILWPPNGNMVRVTLEPRIASESGRDMPWVRTRITSVKCNEVHGLAARKARNSEWQIDGDLTVKLRARKLPGRMNFRIYTITVLAEDGYGHTSTSTVKVVVPPNAPR